MLEGGTSPVRYALRLYRVRDWLHFLPLPLATVDPQPAGAALWAASRGVATAAAILAFGYLLNSVADRRMDRDARKNPLILEGAGEPRLALAALLAAAVALAARGPWPVWVASAVSLFFFTVYSAAPRIKALPVVGSLANIGMFAPLLLLGLRDATSLPPGLAALLIACGALVLETQLVHEAADSHEDRAGGVRTTWLTVGPRHAAAIAAACGLVTAAAAASLGTGAALALAAIAAAIFGAGFPLQLAHDGGDDARAARLRLAHRWCGLAFGAALFAAWRWGL